MRFDETPTHYDVLDLAPDASQQEIREAYLRTKATYSKDSVALYSLIDAGEREEMLRRIEEAYEILSDPEKRKEYDRYYGPLSTGHGMDPFSHPMAPEPQNVVSIDRVPPMETNSSGEDLLVAPTTDFPVKSPAPLPIPTLNVPLPSLPTHPTPLAPPTFQARSGEQGFPFSPPPAAVPVSAPAPVTPPPHKAVDPLQQLMRDIEAETEWKGTFLRRVREIRKISLEELTGITKISKTYILALEEENYARLPAPVYIRGFVSQVARALKLPYQKVAGAYMARYEQASAGKPK